MGQSFSSTLLRQELEKIFVSQQKNQQGHPATYIPELAKANRDHFSLALVTTQGEVLSFGDKEVRFTMQSTSKPFLYSLALKTKGPEFVHSKVGVEPTGEAFNSIIELEEKSHRPFNPMINSGAIATTSLIAGVSTDEKFLAIQKHFQELAGKPLDLDEKVYLSEKATAHRNRAISYLMKYFNVLEEDIEETLDVYFRQCSLLVTTVDLAMMAATLANKGRQPQTGKQVLSPEEVSRTLSLMFTCGMYDSAGEWAFNVGLPAKSGVSGAVFAVVPGKFGIAGFSPNIDEKGHSYRVSEAIKEFSKILNLSIFS